MIYRKLYSKLIAHLSKKEYTILTGARQAGKSTLLRQIESYCKREFMPHVFLNLENKSILKELNESPLNALKYLPETTERIIVLIDEIQYAEDPSNLIKLLYDDHSHKIKIVATGSSAFYIDDKFKDSLAGRKKIFQLHTCSFDEYLQLSNKEDLLSEKLRLQKNKDAKSTQIEYLKQEWENYILFGGYPAVITELGKEEKINRLKELRDSFVKRDILEAGVTNEIAFYHLFRLLAAQTGGLLNINELSKTLKIKNETVSSYITVLQKCFHISLSRPYYRNLKKELTKMPKVFLMDTGLRNCLLNNFQSFSMRLDPGELWENTVFRMLIEEQDPENIHFWRTTAGNEVDFIISDGEKPQAIEAKYDKNEIRSSKYKLFRDAYPEIPISFKYMIPFSEDFFSQLPGEDKHPGKG